jgi:hypothetical protein
MVYPELGKFLFNEGIILGKEEGDQISVAYHPQR